jgi:hypothetical protein
MRTAHFLSLLAGFGALALGSAFADESAQPLPQPAPSDNRSKPTSERPPVEGSSAQPGFGGEQRDAKSLEDQPEGRLASRRGSQSGTGATARHQPGSKLPQPLQVPGQHPGANGTAHAQTKGAEGNAADLHRPRLNTPAGSAKAGSALNKMEGQPRLPVAGLSTPAPRNQVVPRLGPGPAIIGGFANSSARSTAALNGTGMKHKP